MYITVLFKIDFLIVSRTRNQLSQKRKKKNLFGTRNSKATIRRNFRTQVRVLQKSYQTLPTF